MAGLYSAWLIPELASVGLQFGQLVVNRDLDPQNRAHARFAFPGSVGTQPFCALGNAEQTEMPFARASAVVGLKPATVVLDLHGHSFRTVIEFDGGSGCL